MGTFNAGIYPASPGLALGRVGQEWNAVLAAVSASGPLSGAFLNGFVVTAFSATPVFTPVNLNLSFFQITLTGNVTSSTIDTTGMEAGAIVIFEIIQDGVGQRSFAFPPEFQNPFQIGGPPAVASSVYVLPFFFDGTNFYSLAANDLLAAFSRSSTPLSLNYVEINTGLQLRSSLVVNGGILWVDDDAGYLALKNTGHVAYLQAGDPSSGGPTWFADNTFTYPDLAQGTTTPASGYLCATLTNAIIPGNLVRAGDGQGFMDDSGVSAVAGSLAMPAPTNRVVWRNGVTSQEITAETPTANQTVTVPDATGRMVIASGVPANSAAPGVAGQVSYDASFFYVCIAANTWRRVAVAAF